MHHHLIDPKSPLPENLWQAGNFLNHQQVDGHITLVQVDPRNLAKGLKYSLANRAGRSRSNKSLFFPDFGSLQYDQIFDNLPGGAAGHAPMHQNPANTSFFTPPPPPPPRACCVHGHAICADLHSKGLNQDGKRIAGHGFAVLIEYTHGGRVVYLVTSVRGKLRPIAGSFEERDNLCWLECMSRELEEEAAIRFPVEYILAHIVNVALVGRTPAFLLRTSEDISRTALNRVIQDPARRAKGREFREIDGVAMVERNLTVYKPQQGIATAPSEFLTSLMRILL